MKRLTAAAILAFVVTTNDLRAQVYSLAGNAGSIAVSAGEYGYDTGIGIEVGTPRIRNTNVYFRAKGNLVWFERYKAQYDQWLNYKSLNISMGYNVFSEERIGVYVDLGTYIIFPNQKVTQQKLVQGITSTVGLEIFVMTSERFDLSYYFNAGIADARAYADQLENKPRYGHGFLFSNGFRLYWCRIK